MSQQINLFNPIFLKKKKIFAAVPMAQALAVLLFGALGLAYYGSQKVATLKKYAQAGEIQLKAKQERQANVAVEFAPRQKSADLEAQLRAAEAQLNALREVSNMLKGGEFGNTNGYSEYFRAFSRQSVGGLWLTGVTIGGAGDVGVQGRALQAALVPNYIGRLTQEKIMHGKTFTSLRMAQEQVSTLPLKPGETAPIPRFVEFSLQSVPPAPGEAAK